MASAWGPPPSAVIYVNNTQQRRAQHSDRGSRNNNTDGVGGQRSNSNGGDEVSGTAKGRFHTPRRRTPGVHRHRDAPEKYRPQRDMVTRVAFNTTTDDFAAGEGDDENGYQRGESWMGRGGITPGKLGTRTQMEARRAVDTAHGFSHSVHYRLGDKAVGERPPDSGDMEGGAFGDGHDPLPKHAKAYADGMGVLLTDDNPHGEYRPYRRPSQIVQPVDIHHVAGTAMHRMDEAKRMLREMQNAVDPRAKRAIMAGEVPVETSVGNVFSVVMDACRSQGLLMHSSFFDSAAGDEPNSKRDANTNKKTSAFDTTGHQFSTGSGNNAHEDILRLKGSFKGPLVPPILGAKDVIAPPLELLLELAQFASRAASETSKLQLGRSPPQHERSQPAEGETTATYEVQKKALLRDLLSSMQLQSSVASAVSQPSLVEPRVETLMRTLEQPCFAPVQEAVLRYLKHPSDFASPTSAFYSLVAEGVISAARVREGARSTLSPYPASRLMHTSLVDAVASDSAGVVFDPLELQFKYWTFLLSQRPSSVLEALLPSSSSTSPGPPTSSRSPTQEARTQLQRSFVEGALTKAVTGAYKCWDLVESTPLASPNHGTLALQGKAFAESSIVNDVVLPTFPRLRARMLQNIVSKMVSSPMVTMRIANRLGLTDQANYGVEVGFYSDFIILMSQLRHFKELRRIHQNRAERKIFPNSFEKYDRRVASIKRALRRIPVDPDTLHLRYKWLHDLVFSFVGFTVRTEGVLAGKALVLNLFAPAMGRYLHRRTLMKRSLRVLSQSVESQELLQLLQEKKSNGQNTAVAQDVATLHLETQSALRKVLVAVTLSSLEGGAGNGDVERLHADLGQARSIATEVNTIATVALLRLERHDGTQIVHSALDSSTLNYYRHYLQACKLITQNWMTQHIPAGDDFLGNQQILSPASLHPLTQNADEAVIKRTTAAGGHTSSGASDMEGGGAGNMLNMAEEDQNELISGMSVDDARALSALVDGGGRGILDFLQTKSKGKKSDSATISSSGTDGGEDVKALSLIDQLRLLDHTEEDAIEVNALAVRLLRFASWHFRMSYPGHLCQ